jgi:uncharacterized protein YcfL
MKRLLLIPAMLAFTGCAFVKPPIEGRLDPYVPAQVHLDSDALRRDTAIGAPVTTLNESGLLSVTLPIRAASNKTLYVDYRVTFLDRSGTPVGPTLGPFTKTLEANTPDRIVVVSPTPNVNDFQIDLRYAR